MYGSYAPVVTTQDRVEQTLLQRVFQSRAHKFVEPAHQRAQEELHRHKQRRRTRPPPEPCHVTRHGGVLEPSQHHGVGNTAQAMHRLTGGESHYAPTLAGSCTRQQT